MSIQFCKFQDMMFDTAGGITVSSCRNPQCPRLHDAVSELICTTCGLREEPDTQDQRAMASLMADMPDEGKLETRSLAERTKILNTYCLKCKHCDSVTKVCNGCHCAVKIPVDDYVKYTHLHCPLELW